MKIKVLCALLALGCAAALAAAVLSRPGPTVTRLSRPSLSLGPISPPAGNVSPADALYVQTANLRQAAESARAYWVNARTNGPQSGRALAAAVANHVKLTFQFDLVDLSWARMCEPVADPVAEACLTVNLNTGAEKQTVITADSASGDLELARERAWSQAGQARP